MGQRVDEMVATCVAETSCGGTDQKDKVHSSGVRACMWVCCGWKAAISLVYSPRLTQLNRNTISLNSIGTRMN